MNTPLPTADGIATRRALLDLLRARRGAIAGMIVLFAGATAVTLVGPRLLGLVIDEVTGGQDRGVIDAAAAAFLAVTALGAVLTYLAEARAGVVGEDVLASLRFRLFTHTVTLPLATAERAGTGELLARMIGDVAALATAVRYAVPSMVLAAIELLLTAAALVLLSPPLAAATLVGL
ncbi:MAG: ABC transporter transmembrane domain-containing protein, partial [Gammaproteobacteria bacterium]